MVVHQQNEVLKDLKQLKLEMVSQKSVRETDLDVILESFKSIVKVVEPDMLQREHPPKMNSDLLALLAQWLEMRTDHFVLRKLRFYTIDDRFNEISTPHTATYQWIWDAGSTDHRTTTRLNINFARWLASNDSLYWISGKPGSGKSTMMKYISTNQQTIRLLEPWADGSKISVASFFFWNATKERLQKSRSLLLRSLLFQLLSRWPGWIRVLFPDPWQLLKSSTRLTMSPGLPSYSSNPSIKKITLVLSFSSPLNVCCRKDLSRGTSSSMESRHGWLNLSLFRTMSRGSGNRTLIQPGHLDKS